MGTRPLLEARPSRAARNQLRHDWECAEAEVETIYFAPLRQFVFLTHSFHPKCGAQTEVCATKHAPGRVQTRRLIFITAASA
jgi:hypothetical protein